MKQIEQKKIIAELRGAGEGHFGGRPPSWLKVSYDALQSRNIACNKRAPSNFQEATPIPTLIFGPVLNCTKKSSNCQTEESNFKYPSISLLSFTKRKRACC